MPLITKDATSQMIEIYVLNSSATDGSPLTGLVYNTGSLTCYYHREGAASPVVVTLVDATVGTYTSSGFKATDGTNMPGTYEFGIPNAALVTGAKWVDIQFKGAANMFVPPLRIQLIDFDLSSKLTAAGIIQLLHETGMTTHEATAGHGSFAQLFCGITGYVKVLVSDDGDGTGKVTIKKADGTTNWGSALGMTNTANIDALLVFTGSEDNAT